ncbi:MAG TPA: TetR/AcrR family transcriptional regulator [Pseudonocardiaceae bacterium]|jgi:AcrR family transcriptional regulator|nr:TetR/AcrR family transcriptional regulator [Pseudonocardiaceae bacterium]
MAKRQARFTSQDLAGDPQLSDDSPELWPEDLGEVARKLLTSAVRCFAANGYHATTTRDIAAGVGLSPAAMYVHFPTKELVLCTIIRSAHERALADLRTPEVERAGDAAATLRVLISRYTAWHARHHVAARVAQYELAGLTAEHYEDILRLRHQTNEVFRHAVARGVADGTFDRIDVHRVVRAMLSLAIDLIRWYRLDGSDHPEELGEFYAGLALKMVTGPAEPAPRATSGRTARRPR